MTRPPVETLRGLWMLASFYFRADIGHLDHVGRMFVDGRVDDMIVSGGENVFPQEEVAELFEADFRRARGHGSTTRSAVSAFRPSWSRPATASPRTT